MTTDLPAGPRPCDGADEAFVYLNIRVPVALHGIATRDYRHLSALLCTLRDAGVDEGSIRRSLDLLVSQYRDELAAAVAGLAREKIDG